MEASAGGLGSARSNGRDRLPREVAELLAATDPELRDRAWERFLRRHSRLILKVAHQNSQQYDGAMDRYAFVLERLEADDYRRLRQYEDVGTRFTTWLVVVVRRLCLDHHRHVYGRPRAETDESQAQITTRRRLADFVMDEIDPERTVNHNGRWPDAEIRHKELFGALERALDTLSTDDRLVLRLRFEDAAPVSDIATVIGAPTVFHVYRRVNKILKQLRGELRRLGVDGPRP